MPSIAVATVRDNSKLQKLTEIMTRVTKSVVKRVMKKVVKREIKMVVKMAKGVVKRVMKRGMKGRNKTSLKRSFHPPRMSISFFFVKRINENGHIRSVGSKSRRRDDSED